MKPRPRGLCCGQRRWGAAGQKAALSCGAWRGLGRACSCGGRHGEELGRPGPGALSGQLHHAVTGWKQLLSRPAPSSLCRQRQGSLQGGYPPAGLGQGQKGRDALPAGPQCIGRCQPRAPAGSCTAPSTQGSSTGAGRCCCPAAGMWGPRRASLALLGPFPTGGHMLGSGPSSRAQGWGAGPRRSSRASSFSGTLLRQEAAGPCGGSREGGHGRLSTWGRALGPSDSDPPLSWLDRACRSSHVSPHQGVKASSPPGPPVLAAPGHRLLQSGGPWDAELLGSCLPPGLDAVHPGGSKG